MNFQLWKIVPFGELVPVASVIFFPKNKQIEVVPSHVAPILPLLILVVRGVGINRGAMFRKGTVLLW